VRSVLLLSWKKRGWKMNRWTVVSLGKRVGKMEKVDKQAQIRKIVVAVKTMTMMKNIHLFP
jgi:hypothetical protein